LEDLENNLEPSNISDYTPISVLPALSKAIEIIMKHQINAFLMDKGILSDYQSGFRTHHSTSMAPVVNYE
jgi:DhnA family fructose-bisphosphate aldolase class Ia